MIASSLAPCYITPTGSSSAALGYSCCATLEHVAPSIFWRRQVAARPRAAQLLEPVEIGLELVIVIGQSWIVSPPGCLAHSG